MRFSARTTGALVCILFSVGGITNAQKMAVVGRTLEIPIKSIAAEHGLSQGMINDVAEDREGFLWVVRMHLVILL